MAGEMPSVHFELRPAMPDYLRLLDGCERLLLRCFRRWTLGLSRAEAPELEAAWNELASSLGPCQARQALDALSMLVFRLAGASRRAISHHHPCCPMLTLDERRLIRLIACAQAGQEEEASRTAAALIATDAVSGVLEGARRLADALARAGHRLPERAEAGPLAVACLAPESATIH